MMVLLRIVLPWQMWRCLRGTGRVWPPCSASLCWPGPHKAVAGTQAILPRSCTSFRPLNKWLRTVYFKFRHCFLDPEHFPDRHGLGFTPVPLLHSKKDNHCFYSAFRHVTVRQLSSYRPLKGQRHKIFYFRFFFMDHLPQAPDFPSSTISNFQRKFEKTLQTKWEKCLNRGFFIFCWETIKYR